MQSWDLSFKHTEGSDFVVGLVAARDGAQVYLIDRYKARASFSETCQAIRMMSARYPTTHAVIVEDAANGAAVVDALQREIAGLILVPPEGGKTSRAAAVQPIVEAGQVFLPSPRWPDGAVRADRTWVDDFVAACAVFPRGSHDDDVDALTQLLVYCGKAGDPGPLSKILPGPADFGPEWLAGTGLTFGNFRPY